MIPTGSLRARSHNGSLGVEHSRWPQGDTGSVLPGLLVASAIVADIGPKDQLGEGSIALAEALGIPSSPRTGGVKSNVAYGVFPQPGNRKPRPVEDISKGGARLLAEFGGAAQLSACSAEAR